MLELRPAVLALVPAIVIAQNWLRLERPERAGGPARLLPAGHGLVRGAVIFAAALVLLAGFRADSGHTLARAAVLAGALVAVSLAASTQPAVAKGEFLHWQTWDLYTRPTQSV